LSPPPEKPSNFRQGRFVPEARRRYPCPRRRSSAFPVIRSSRRAAPKMSGEALVKWWVIGPRTPGSEALLGILIVEFLNRLLAWSVRIASRSSAPPLVRKLKRRLPLVCISSSVHHVLTAARCFRSILLQSRGKCVLLTAMVQVPSSPRHGKRFRRPIHVLRVWAHLNFGETGTRAKWGHDRNRCAPPFFFNLRT